MEIEEFKKYVKNVREDSWSHLEKDPETGKISGYVISGEFRGRLDRERQQAFWDYLQEVLKQRIADVGTILLNTPEEYEAMTAVDEAG